MHRRLIGRFARESRAALSLRVFPREAGETRAAVTTLGVDALVHWSVQPRSVAILVSESWRLALALSRAAIAVLLVLLELYPQWYPLSTNSMIYMIFVLYS